MLTEEQIDFDEAVGEKVAWQIIERFDANGDWMPQSERLPCEKCEIAATVNEAYAKNKTYPKQTKSPCNFCCGAFCCTLASYSSQMPRRDEGPREDLRRFGKALPRVRGQGLR